jgi:integrase/recombinase XerD
MYRINGDVVSPGMSKHGRDGPIGPYLASFAHALSGKGYKRGSLQAHARLAMDFSRWLKNRRIRLCDACSTHASRYLRYRHRTRCATSDEGAALDHLLNFLREKGALQENKPSKARLIGTARCAQAYEQYLRKDRGLTEATIICYLPFVVSFLKYKFGAGPVKLSSLRAEHVVRFVKAQARQLHLKRAKLMTTALRSFLQYAVCWR